MTTLVVGAAVSGQAAVRLLERSGTSVVVYDHDPERAAASAADGRMVFGGAWSDAVLEGVDLVVTSPGVPEHAAPLQAADAAGLPIWSEIELAFRHLDVPVVAVTGTNGKTTVTELAASMLSASGRPAKAVGNIGEPLSDAVDEACDVMVVEASSFQLRFIDAFAPHASAIINVAPDHLDWHRSVDGYLAAKRRIFEHHGPDNVLTYDADDAGARAAVSGAPSHLVPASGTGVPEGGVGVDGDKLRAGGAVIDVGDLARQDATFLVDVAIAAVLAEAAGGTAEGITEAARSYVPGRHRREVVGVIDDVTYVDDSKATNPHAALAAIGAYPSVVLIAGGRNKGLDVTPLSSAPSVRYLIGLGEAGPDLVARATDGVMATDMADAVARARAVAVPGDTVLLAPGCASFDMFESYAARGEAFARAVQEVR